jgi:cation transport regulator ChaC
MVWYFAYGSNLDEERMKERVGVIKNRVKGVLRGYVLKFNKKSRNPGEGYANVEPASDGCVEGAAYEINDIVPLDRYEGVPEHYLRVTLPIGTERGVLNCEVYIANKAMIGGNLRPTKAYLQHLLKGKDLLSHEYFAMLEKTPTLD